MLDEDFARIRTHRNNIHRYRSLLKTQVTSSVSSSNGAFPRRPHRSRR